MLFMDFRLLYFFYPPSISLHCSEHCSPAVLICHSGLDIIEVIKHGNDLNEKFSICQIR